MRLAYVCKNFYVPMYVKTQPFIAWMFIMEDEKFYVPMYVNRTIYCMDVYNGK